MCQKPVTKGAGTYLAGTEWPAAICYEKDGLSCGTRLQLFLEEGIGLGHIGIPYLQFQ